MIEETISTIWNKHEKENPGNFSELVRFLSIITAAAEMERSDVKLYLEERDNRILVEYSGVSKQLNIPRFDLESARQLRNRLFVFAKQDYTAHRESYFTDLDFSNLNFIKSNIPKKWKFGYLRTAAGWRIMMNPINRRMHLTIDQLGLLPEQIQAFDKVLSDGFGLFVIGGIGSAREEMIEALVKKLAVDGKKSIIEIGAETPAARNEDRTQLLRNPSMPGSVWNSAIHFNPEVVICTELRSETDVTKACEAALAGIIVVVGLHSSSPERSLERMLALAPNSDLLAEALKLIATAQSVKSYQDGEDINIVNRLIVEIIPISPKSQSNLRRTGNHAKLIELIKEKEGYLDFANIIEKLQEAGIRFDASDLARINRNFG